MRDDLLDAQSAVDWAVSQFDTLKDRLIAWREIPPYSFVEDTHPDPGKKFIRLRGVKQPPLIINAEVGAIINSIRSSLDILITSVAARSTKIAPTNAYFPIARSHTHWINLDYKGNEVIKGLVKADQTVIESLEPWRGGNNPKLIALHDLDTLRKHRRLIAVKPLSTGLAMLTSSGAGRRISFQTVWPGFEEDAIVATVEIDRDYSDIDLPLEIRINEAGVEDLHLIEALNDFASLSNSIIKRFA